MFAQKVIISSDKFKYMELKTTFTLLWTHTPCVPTISLRFSFRMSYPIPYISKLIRKSRWSHHFSTFLTFLHHFYPTIFFLYIKNIGFHHFTHFSFIFSLFYTYLLTSVRQVRTDFILIQGKSPCDRAQSSGNLRQFFFKKIRKTILKTEKKI